MKYCPSCQSTYADDSLQFCLQDGTGLLSYSGKSSQLQTEAFGETETVVRQKPLSPDWGQSQTTQATAFEPESKRSHTFTTIILTALAMCVFFGVVVGMWILLGDNSAEIKIPSNTNTKNASSPPSPTPTSSSERRQNQIDFVDRNAVFSPEEWMLNPLLLVVEITEDGKLSLNKEEAGTTADVSLLSFKLQMIFASRESGGINEREVIINPQGKVKSEDMEILIKSLADVKASPIRVIKF